jgi:hypothetical protein
MSLTNPYTRQSAYQQALRDVQDLEEEERRRARRAADEQAVSESDAAVKPYVTPRPPLPAPSPQPRQEGINWGKAIGEVIGKVGTAVVEKLTESKPVAPVVAPPALVPPDLDLPAPVVDPNPPPPPSEGETLPFPSLRPAQTAPQLADVQEFRRRLEGAEGRADDAAEDERRRRALVPASVREPMDERLPDGTNASMIGLPDALKRAAARMARRDGAAPVASENGFERPHRFTPAPVSDATLPPAAARLRPGDPLTAELQPIPEAMRAAQRRARSTTAPKRADYDLSTPEGTRAYADALRNYDPEDHNGRLKSFLIGLGRGFLSGGLPGALVSGVAHAASPSLDEQYAHGQNMGLAATAETALGARAKLQGELAGQQASTRLHNAQANDLETQKPLRDVALREDREKRALLGQLRGMPAVDPTKHAAFLGEWRKTFGDDFDVQGWNNKKGNFIIRGLVTDPAKPQEKHDVAVNLATGEQKDLGLSGYAVPLDAQGMSENQRRTDVDRDDTRENLESFRAQLLGLSTQRLHESMLNGLTGRAARLFGTKTAGLFTERTAIENRIKDYTTRKAALLIDPDEADKQIRELEKKRDELTGQIDDARSEAVGEMSSAPSVASPTPAAPTQPGTKGRVSRKNFDKVREDNPSLRGKSDAEVEAALRARGIEVY